MIATPNNYVRYHCCYYYHYHQCYRSRSSSCKRWSDPAHSQRRGIGGRGESRYSSSLTCRQRRCRQLVQGQVSWKRSHKSGQKRGHFANISRGTGKQSATLWLAELGHITPAQRRLGSGTRPLGMTLALCCPMHHPVSRT